MIIEMRSYKLKPGKRAHFLDIFRARSVPAHDEIGMKILGPFLSIEDPDTFFFMRGFPDLDSREPMKAKFYEGELWKRELENLLMPMIEKYDVVLVDDPEGKIHWYPCSIAKPPARGAFWPRGQSRPACDPPKSLIPEPPK